MAARRVPDATLTCGRDLPRGRYATLVKDSATCRLDMARACAFKERRHRPMRCLDLEALAASARERRDRVGVCMPYELRTAERATTRAPQSWVRGGCDHTDCAWADSTSNFRLRATPTDRTSDYERCAPRRAARVAIAPMTRGGPTVRTGARDGTPPLRRRSERARRSSGAAASCATTGWDASRPTQVAAPLLIGAVDPPITPSAARS